VRYFLTGATGFIGGAVLRRLVAAGHDVVALVRNPAKAAGLKAAAVTLHAGDITDRESMRAGMLGCDGVYHVAGWYKVGVRDATDAQPINVDGTRNVLTLMRDLGIPKGVYTSTLAVFSNTRGAVVDETYHHDGPHLSEYDRTKAAAHYEIAEPMIRDGLPLVVVQPGGVYGPGDNGPFHETFARYLRRRLPMLPAGAGYCWGHVEDTARGHVLAMERGRTGESYIIAGPPHTLVDVFALAERITGVPAPRLVVPAGLLQRMAAVTGTIGRAIPLPADLNAERLRVLAGVTYFGKSDKALRELGFQARPLAAGLVETMAWEQEQIGPHEAPQSGG
jgi:nucleoside-diphosphate-sugar epimerase